MDDDLRALERRWKAGDAAALEPLYQAHARAGREPPDEVVRAHPRWARLLGFAARWLARPPGAPSGTPVETILAREADLGLRLPTVLREWYRLVGASLTPTIDSDIPVRLHELALEEGFLPVYRAYECGAWGITRAGRKLEDPAVYGFAEGERGPRVAKRLSEFLVAKVIIETTSARGTSPLGPVHRSVRGIEFGAAKPERAALLRRYPRLPCDVDWMDGTLLLGDRETVVVLCGNMGCGIARTDDAWSTLRSFPGLRIWRSS